MRFRLDLLIPVAVALTPHSAELLLERPHPFDMHLLSIRCLICGLAREWTPPPEVLEPGPDTDAEPELTRACGLMVCALARAFGAVTLR